MIGKAHGRGYTPCKSCSGCKNCSSISVKHSLASTALSRSNANSIMMVRENTERKMVNSTQKYGLSRALSSSSILETAVKALDELARRNKKSHLLKKYA